MDFDDDTIAQQISLIEQNFFSSIKQREFLCDTWEDDEMELKAPNILAMRQNLELLRRWTCTQVLTQSSWHRQYSTLTVLVFVAEVFFIFLLTPPLVPPFSFPFLYLLSSSLLLRHSSLFLPSSSPASISSFFSPIPSSITPFPYVYQCPPFPF